jgi:hypothetical protein
MKTRSYVLLAMSYDKPLRVIALVGSSIVFFSIAVLGYALSSVILFIKKIYMMSVNA